VGTLGSMLLASCRSLAPRRFTAGFHRQAQSSILDSTDPALPAPPHIRPGTRRNEVSGVVATVFGCTGFLGRYVVGLLGEMGSQVICPFRSDGMNARHLKLKGDLGQILPTPFQPRDVDSIRRVVERSNVVINLIGQDRPTIHWSFDEVHVGLAQNIAQISKECGAERFIHMSALRASPDNPSQWLSSKARGEEAVRSVFPEATIFRPCSIFGAEDRFINRYASWASKLPLIPVLAGGVQQIQPVFVEDVAQAIVSSLNTRDAVGATYELGGPEVWMLKDLLDYVFETTGWESNSLTLPLPVARLYARIAQYLPVIPLTADLVNRMLTDSLVQPSPGVKTFADLDIKPTPLRRVAKFVLHYHTNFWGRSSQPSRPEQ